MTRRAEQRGQLVVKLAAHFLAAGLSQTSLRQLAVAAGTSDRMLLYYFRDKADLLESVLTRIAGDLADRFDADMPWAGRVGAPELCASVFAMTARPELRSYMHLWSEIAAAAARGHQPFLAIASQIASGFHAWTEARLDIASLPQRQQVASLLLVAIDGGALLAPLAGGRITEQAIEALVDLLTAIR